MAHSLFILSLSGLQIGTISALAIICALSAIPMTNSFRRERWKRRTYDNPLTFTNDDAGYNFTVIKLDLQHGKVLLGKFQTCKPPIQFWYADGQIPTELLNLGQTFSIIRKGEQFDFRKWHDPMGKVIPMRKAS